MSISPISLNTVLASDASTLSGQEIQSQIAVAVMKQIQGQQELQAQALLKMMQPAPSLDGTGRIVNVSA